MDPLDLLSRAERRWYRLADFLARRLPWLAIAWNSLFMTNVVRLVAGRRLRIEGLEHLVPLGPRDRVVLVANHRSFFDFFIIGAVFYTRSRLPRRVLFPVRATFFYDSWLGALVNGVMAGFTMFPPIAREPRRQAYNRHALKRCIEALQQPGQVIGLHPEGRRNRSEDPLALLRPQPGVGRIALACPEAVLVPVWIHGLSNSVTEELRRQWRDPDGHPIEVSFGPPVAVDELRGQGAQAALPIAERCMAAIAALGEARQAAREGVRQAS